FVLASGTMDRHLTYVGMTRHREAVTIYAGRDEFKDIDALSGRLSRAELKETTLDYAARRGIEEPIIVPEGMRRGTRDRAATPTQEPTPKRGMFDGLTLKSRPRAPDMGRIGDLLLSTSDRAKS